MHASIICDFKVGFLVIPQQCPPLQRCLSRAHIHAHAPCLLQPKQLSLYDSRPIRMACIQCSCDLLNDSFFPLKLFTHFNVLVAYGRIGRTRSDQSPPLPLSPQELRESLTPTVQVGPVSVLLSIASVARVVRSAPLLFEELPD
ncbi:hypothetical protein HMPREF1487_09141 [Pseudomonas sp. HPB0071]|nr:hypothetical protein HMPREF1487_09141 [Pseudomonas sp. HPB0071]